MTLMTTHEACEYLRFTSDSRLISLYRWCAAHGIRKYRRSPRRILIAKEDIDKALMGAPRRRHAMALTRGDL